MIPLHSATTNKPKRPTSIAWQPTLTVGLLIVLLHSWQLGTPPLAGTEGHRALTADQMVQSGNWLVPHLWDNVYLRKPPLQYWLIASLQSITGISNPWIWRIPAVLCTGLLAASLVAFASWLAGKKAGWCTGLAFACLLPLWGQSRSADIDAANTCFAVIAALGLLSLQHKTIHLKQTLVLMLIVFIGVAATLMLKVHAGMPVILGAWVMPSCLDYKSSRKPWDWRLWLPLFIGVIPLLVWSYLVYQQFQDNVGQADTRGLTEMSNNVTGHMKDYLKALLLPMMLLAYALPVSLGLIVMQRWLKGVVDLTPQTRRLLRYLRSTVILSVMVYLLAATHKPRYAYPVLPLLCPIMGIFLSQWLSLQQANKWQQVTTKLVGVFLWMLVIGHVILQGVLIHLNDHVTATGIIALSIAIIAGVSSEWHLRKSQFTGALIGLAVVLATLTVPIAQMRIHEQQRGGVIAAQSLIDLTRDRPQQIILARKVAYDQPELFYYAGRQTSLLPPSLDVQTILKGHAQCTLVLHPSEYELIQDALEPYLIKQAQMPMHDRQLWVVWLDADAQHY